MLLVGFKEVEVETGRYIYEWSDKGRIYLNESTFLGAKASTSFEDACSKEWGQSDRSYLVLIFGS